MRGGQDKGRIAVFVAEREGATVQGYSEAESVETMIRFWDEVGQQVVPDFLGCKPKQKDGS